MNHKSILYIILCVCLSFSGWTQEGKTDQNLSDFTMSNPSSPAFSLVGESPTEIYTPTNLKALALHVFNNFGESFSIEVAPYFFINRKSKNRTYYKYIGIEEDQTTGEVKQKPFRGLNTTTLSFAYVDKEFEGIVGKRKTYAVGLRTTLLRFYDKDKIYEEAKKVGDILKNLDNPPVDILADASGDDPVKRAIAEKAIIEHYKKEKERIRPQLKEFKKTVKPYVSVDGAIGYSALFKGDKIDSGTANRLGSWITGQGSLVLNEGSDSERNNYLNVLVTARYIEDEFNIDANDQFFKTFYRDLGAKVELEIDRFSLAYEYISRSGSINSERSVGTLKYTLSKDITLIGGFGKDFPVDDNLVTVFGINWGVNFGGKVAMKE
ncbi:hypothetical protein IWQ47_001119 [Aquimarina sp. EL_43]|uniref:hypothetical protein n=1 Tax=unclassified Aquimarina TaxID=2627091 RepID=UPI0018CAD4BB|nr:MULTISPECIES: hypothetical protein [unclassified Aquimarina]MBG6129578.1 hypothetical protein [Aquimarina sp. EL_35]MBG6150643.1 hypothetical protein [Aquimarina sp. EL_32]MBG6168049.1 hypothetical protein [Aquimarina sp. EL_43]